jgi:hypothetical protein
MLDSVIPSALCGVARKKMYVGVFFTLLLVERGEPVLKAVTAEMQNVQLGRFWGLPLDAEIPPIVSPASRIAASAETSRDVKPVRVFGTGLRKGQTGSIDSGVSSSRFIRDVAVQVSRNVVFPKHNPFVLTGMSFHKTVPVCFTNLDI